ncbi:MAG: 4Fe-4S binding protein [Chloroflexota bacterium]
MIYINDTMCNGCGDCVDVCPTGALILYNHRAFIHQELCEGCEVCIDVCPQGAILTGEALPVSQEVIQVSQTPAVNSTSLVDGVKRVSVRDMALPAIGSILLWTGRELIPRLADIALEYLDRRVPSSQSAPTQELGMRRHCPVSMSTPQGKRGRRQRRRRKNGRFS